MRLEDFAQMIDQALLGKGRLYGFDCKTALGRAELLNLVAQMIAERSWPAGDADKALALKQHAQDGSLKACEAQIPQSANRRKVVVARGGASCGE